MPDPASSPAADREPLSAVLALALGLFAATVWLSATALAAPGPSPQEPVREEVVVSAARAADAVLTAKVEKVIRDDPYIFADHVTVTVENGVVTVEGTVFDVQDLRRVLRLARRVAGKHRVINRVELEIADDDGTG
jgi:osmotically-inducible protein OsmY